MEMKVTKLMKSIALFAMVLLITVCAGIGSEKVQAASVGSVTDIRQTGAEKKSVTVTWGAAANAAAYNVYYQEYGEDNMVLAGSTTNTSYTLNGLNGGTKYRVKVAATDGVTEGYGTTSYTVTLPDKMTGLQQSKWWYFIKQLDVKWETQSGVEGYEVTLYDDKGKKVSKKTINSSYTTSTSFTKMKDKVYTVKARSFMTYNGKKYYSSTASICCLNQARISKIKVSGNKLKLTWGKVSGATGYQIYVSTKKSSGYRKVATVSSKKNSYTVKKFNGKKFSSKKTYYVYVKTVCNKGKSKNTSGAVYYWNSKTGSFGWI